MEEYIVSLLVNAGTTHETMRDTCVIHAVGDYEATEEAEKWAGERAIDGDELQIVKNGHVIRSIPLGVSNAPRP
jgi:hypothetical protein